jgi:hypothetical protein
VAELVLDRLRELQQADKELRRLEDQKTGYDRKAKVRADQIVRQEQAIELLRQQHREVRKHTDQKELEVRQKRADIERLKQQQMQVKDNRQYAILQNEIKFLELAIGKLEDEILADLEDVEAADKEVKEAQAQLARSRQELEALHKEIESRKDELDAEIAKCHAQREELAKALPPKVVDQFNRIADRLQGEALAPVIRDEDEDEAAFMCGGCNMGLTQNTYVRLAGRSEDLVTCPNCTRILYLEEP